MTTTATKKTSNLAKLNKAKASVKKINNNIIDTTFDALKIAVKNGEKWQKLTKKLIKKSEPLKAKQVQLFTETADALKDQFESGTNRLKDLVGFDEIVEKVSQNPLAKKAEKFTEMISDKLRKEVKETIIITEKLKNEISKTIDEAKDKLEDVAENVKEKFEDVTEKVKDKVEDVVEETIEDVKETIEKVEKVVSVKNETEKDDLKVIHRVGPKMEKTLNKAGITTYKELAKISIKKLDNLLTEAGVNTKMYNLSDWKAQAKEAAKGNMDAVAALIKEIKASK